MHRVYMRDFFRCEPGQEDLAAQTTRRACVKLVKDMHYKTRVQAIVDHFARRKVKVTKTEAREMRLSREDYIRVNIEP